MQPTFVMARGNEANLAVPPVDLFPGPTCNLSLLLQALPVILVASRICGAGVHGFACGRLSARIFRRIARVLPDLLARALFHQQFYMQQISVMPRGRFTQLGGWLSIGAMLSGEK